MMQMWRAVPVQFVWMHSAEVNIIAFLKRTIERCIVRMPFSGGESPVTMPLELLREGGMCLRNFHAVRLDTEQSAPGHKHGAAGH